MSTLPMTDLDYTSQQGDLERRQKLADALMQSGLQGMQNPGRMVGNYFVPGTANALAGLAQLFIGNRQSEGLIGERQRMAQEQQKRLQGGMARYLEQRQGIPGQEMGPPTPDGQMGGYSGRPADPTGAAAGAIASGHPVLQKLGMQDLEALSKGMITPEMLLKAPGMSPESRVTAAGGGGLGALKPELPKPIEVNGQLVQPPTAGGQPQVLGDFRTKDNWGQPFQRGGDWYQRNNLTGEEKKLDNAPKITNTVQGGNAILPKGQTKGAETLFKEAGETVAEMGKGARASVGLMSTLGQLEELTKSGTLGGPGANIGIFLGQLGRSMGLPIDPKTVNSENFVSIAKEAVHKLAQPYGGGKGLTAPEMAQLDKVIPQLEQSPEARLQLITILRTAAQRNIDDFRKADAAYKRALKADDVELLPTFETFVPNAQPTAPVPGAPVPQAPAGSGARVEGGVVVRGWPKQ